MAGGQDEDARETPTPTGLENSSDIFARATRLAEALFAPAWAHVTLLAEGGIWRSNDPKARRGAKGTVARTVAETGEVLWVPDARADTRFQALPLVTGTPYIRGIAGAPIRLEDGSIPGALVVGSPNTRAFDSELAARLQDLADLIAEEWRRIRALEAAQRSEERLKAALEIAQVHVWDMDFVGRRLAKIGDEAIFFDVPTTYESLVDWGIADVRDVPAMKAAWRAHEEEGAPYHPMFRARRGDGKEVWATGSARMVKDEKGRPLRLIGAMQDITERKLAEDALRKAKEEAEAATHAKSAFLATMSHEIRTPLNGVLGMAQAMASDPLEPHQRARLDVIHQSGEALLAILNDILDLSKIEAGKLELEDAEFDIAEIAGGAQATFAATAQSKGLEFQLHIAPRARGSYRGDPVRVRQILFNLVSNALKFTDKGRVAISIDRQGGRLRLTVTDTGIGIPQDKAEGLFQKFEQADASTTRRYGGTGLGLAICRDLAEMMGGAISVVSEEGQGAQFRVELPLKKVPKAARAAQVQAPAAAILGEDLVLRVLAAEDNQVNQLVLQTLLHQIGVEPVIVPDGRAAVAAWEREPWDLILMDVQMPDMDGPTATAIIRAREAAQGRPRTRIVALTANAMEHQVAEYRASGMDGFVAKPVEAARLFEAVLETLAEAVARTAA